VWRLYKPLKYALRTLVGLGLLWPLLQGCALGFLRGTGCRWQPILDFVDTYYLWIALLLFVLIVLNLTTWQQFLRHEASESFGLLKPANELQPEDLGFRVVGAGEEAELEEHPALSLRPFHESAYVDRLAIPYEQRTVANPATYYDEDDLVDCLREGKGFVLIGHPEEGKTRTLYEVVKRMDGYIALTPNASKEIPEKAHLSRLLKGSKVILLLDDLSNLRNSESDLLEFQQRLRDCEVPWVVASTCQDEPELTRARGTLGRLYYDNRNLKLWLVEPTPQQRQRLAENIWIQPWNPVNRDDYPTLGSIAMSNAMEEMKRRFDILSDDHPERADLLRALKLLDYAGVPCTHERIHALLEDESLSRRRDPNVTKSLDALASQGYLRTGSADPVEPERAYLRKTVEYVPGRMPEDDFDQLADILEEIEDAEGMFYLGTTCSLRSKTLEQAITYFDRSLHLSPNAVGVLINKGATLASLRRYEEALEAFDAALGIEFDHALVLNSKGVVLSRLERHKEALVAFDAALKTMPDFPDALNNKGFALSTLGYHKEALEAYNAALRIKPNFLQALHRKGWALSNLGRPEEALKAYNAVLEIKPDLPGTLTNKGIVLAKLGNPKEALEAHNAALKIDPGLLQVFTNKGSALHGLGRLWEALEAYNAALKIEPDYPEALYNKSSTRIELGRPKETLKASNAALRIVPNQIDAHIGLGVALAALERREEALQAFNAALELDPHDTVALRNKGRVLDELGRPDEAREAYKEAHRAFQARADR